MTMTINHPAQMGWPNSTTMPIGGFSTLTRPIAESMTRNVPIASRAIAATRTSVSTADEHRSVT